MCAGHPVSNEIFGHMTMAASELLITVFSHEDRLDRDMPLSREWHWEDAPNWSACLFTSQPALQKKI